MITIEPDLLEIQGKELILDAGCGNGRHIWQICKVNKGTSIALDIDINSLQRARYMLQQMDEKSETAGNWHLVVGSVTTFPFGDAFFHKVICSEVLEHIPNLDKAMSELNRVLKPGGMLAISVPSYFAEKICWKISNEYHNTPGGHIRIFKHIEIIDLLERFNFKITKVCYKHALHSIYWWLKGVFGLKNDRAFIPSQYYKFLVWDICNGHRYTRWLENILNRIIPKSTVIYCRKPLS